jgi:hypothetical protein
MLMTLSFLLYRNEFNTLRFDVLLLNDFKNRAPASESAFLSRYVFVFDQENKSENCSWKTCTR